MSISINIPFIKRKRKDPKQVISRSWNDRDAILDADVNLFCWKRPNDRKIFDYLNQLNTQSLKSISFYTNIENLGRELSTARMLWDPDHDSEADAFWIDVFHITRDFLELANVNGGTVYLRQIRDNSCRKFHVDGYKLRLFTTYQGKGTEWLPEDATRRNGLGKSNDLIVKDPSKIRQMEAFEVAILKGDIPGAQYSPRGIVHRSPQIEHTDKKRIILRVDI